MSSISALNSALSQIDPMTGKVANSAAQDLAAAANGGSSSSTGGTNGLASESTFLTLLVAQLKNQDPAQPADGTQFVTQLAQFTTLEQSLAMRTDLDSINKKTIAPAATTGTTATSGS